MNVAEMTRASFRASIAVAAAVKPVEKHRVTTDHDDKQFAGNVG
jgi:hypothetical protein